MSFIAGAGITNVDLLYSGTPRIPAVGEEVYTEGFDIQLGGGLPATLITLSRLGIPSKIATELGDDLFSAYAVREYEKNGVTPLNLYHGSGIPLNVTSAMILPEDRSFLTYGKGNLTPDADACEAFYRMAHGAKIVLMQRGGFTDAYQKLHDEGTLLVFDTGWDDDMSLEAYADTLTLADYYTPNCKEALKITGTSHPDDALRVLKQYFKHPLVKLDKDGCMALNENGETVFIPSIDEFTPVDSTGAGDAFLAGFCYGLYYNYPLEDCLLFGNITGGNAVTAVGALAATMDEKRLLRYFKKYGA